MSVVTVTIKSEGKEMNHEFGLLSIDISKEFNKIPTAELMFIDGNIATKSFRILEDESFEIGKTIEIALRYEGDAKNEKQVFTGIVVNKLFELNTTGPTLTIELSDIAIKLNSHRNNLVYSNKKDSDIIKNTIKQNGLAVGVVEATQVQHTQMVQYYATDWDFMISRAEANAQFVSVNDGKVSVFQPKVKQEVISLELGLDEIYDFDLQLNATNQYKEVTATSWDISKQDFTKSIKGDEYKLHQKGTDISKAASALGTSIKPLINTAHLEPRELKAWSDSQVLKSRLSFIKGWIKIPGRANLNVGDTIAIKGMSTVFSGKNVISGVRHEVTVNNWSTHLQIGVEMCNFSSKRDIQDTPAAGLLPGINGLQIGVIKALDKDKENLFRVKVFIPAFGANQNTVWARLSTLDGGLQHGTFFIPEVGDEVIVGFLNDDPRHAIILGSVYGPKNKPPLDFQEHKHSKGIFTKSGYQLILDEAAQEITIATSAKNKIIINEKSDVIAVSDTNGNAIELSKNGIRIDSAKDCEITSKGNLSLTAKGKVSIEGKSVELI